MLITVTPHVDPANDTVTLVLDLTGNDPFQHEFLRKVFADELCTTDSEDGEVHGKPLGADDLRVRLSFKTPGASVRASHTLENQRRVSAGLPTIKQEAAQKAADEQKERDAQAAAETAQLAAAAKADADRKALAADIAAAMQANK